MMYAHFTKTHSKKGKIDFDALEADLLRPTELLKLLEAAAHRIEAALKKLKLGFDDGVRSKALTDLLAKE